MPHESKHTGPGIVDDLTVELQQWTECFIAFGVAQSTVSYAVERMRDASTEPERDSIRLEVRGFMRRLALGMLAIALPGDELVETVKETGETL